MHKFFRRLCGCLPSFPCLIRDDRGVTMVEYGILVAVIALVAIVGATAFGQGVLGLFTAIPAP